MRNHNDENTLSTAILTSWHGYAFRLNGIRRSPTQLISDVQPSTVVELTAIWYYVMLMWCHYNDKWAVNFNVLMFLETIVYKNWESLNCPVSLWFEICALESVGRFDVPGGTVLSLQQPPVPTVPHPSPTPPPIPHPHPTPTPTPPHHHHQRMAPW